MGNRNIIIYCGLLLTLTASSIDILLPAFSLIAADLNAPYEKVQLVIPVFLGAVGLGQLFGGSLSDRFGRRAVIKYGLSLFIIGVLICLFASNIETILVGRFLQGLGAAIGPVIGRAIIRDLFSGKELARNMALAVAVFALGPIVAPLVGAVLLQFFDWHSLFIVMLIFASLLLAYCLIALPETIPQKNKTATKPSIFFTNIVAVFRNPQSRFFVLLSAVMHSIILIILINVPVIYEKNFGITGALFAVLFAIHGFGIIIGQIFNRKFIEQFGVARTTFYSSIGLLVVSVMIVLVSLLDWMNAYVLTGLLVAHASFYLVLYSNAAAMTLEPHGKIAGFTSSFYGFFSQLVASLIGVILLPFIKGDLVIWSSLLLAFAFATFVALFIRHRADENLISENT